MWVLLAALFALAGLMVRFQRVETERRALAGLLVIAAATTYFGWTKSSPIWAGVLLGVGLSVWRELDPRWDFPWMAATGVLGGLLLYFLGWLMLPGVIGGAGLAWLSTTWAAGRLHLDATPGTGRVRPYRQHVLVCYGGPCQIRGAPAIREALAADARFRQRQGVRVSLTSCLGHCHQGPVCWVEPAGRLSLHVEPAHVGDLLAAATREGESR
jgi:(2Fe-2S) ferredoxin